MRNPVRWLAVLVLFLGACGGSARELTTPDQAQPVQGQPYVLEVENAFGHAMNVSYSIGGVVTVLGTVEAGKTARFNIPNRGSDEIRVIASDSQAQHRVEKTVDLESERPVKVKLQM